MKKGFTLIELLIVMAVIAIIIGIALPRFKGMQDEANINKAKAELKTLQSAVESYYIHNAAYPAESTAAGSNKFSDLPSQTPQIITAIPNDPFAATGTLYAYQKGGTPDKYYVIYSVGPAGNGYADILATNTVTQQNTGGTDTSASCIYVSNAGVDDKP